MIEIGAIILWLLLVVAVGLIIVWMKFDYDMLSAKCCDEPVKKSWDNSPDFYAAQCEVDDYLREKTKC